MCNVWFLMNLMWMLFDMLCEDTQKKEQKTFNVLYSLMTY